ncbi:MAG: hypothetical protein ACOX2N_08195 [Peptococcia bacterium]
MKKPDYKLPLKDYVEKVRLEEFLRRKFIKEAEEATNVENNLKVNKTKEPSQKKNSLER